MGAGPFYRDRVHTRNGQVIDIDVLAAELAADGSKPAGMASNGVKLDAGKVRHELLPPDAINEVARVFTFGAQKYADRNWEKGMDWGRVYGATHRHLSAFWSGESHDAESAVLHTAAAGFGALVLTAYQLRSAGKDDRFIVAPSAPRAEPEQLKSVKFGSGRDSGKVSLSAEDFRRLLDEAGR